MDLDKKISLESKIEAVLFFNTEPTTTLSLSKLLGVDKKDIEKTLSLLEENLKGRGIALIRNKEKIVLGTAPEVGELIEEIKKEKLSRELGKAGIETLSIILYYGPITRREVEHIRGVNSSFIVRNLLIRGLIERKANTKDLRSFLYSHSVETLAFLGIKNIEELPEYNQVREEIKKWQISRQENEERENPYQK